MLNSNTSRRIVKSRSSAGKTITIILAILFAAGLNSGRAQGTWTQKADFGGIARGGAVGFSIDTKGYIGTGDDGSLQKNDFWQYDPATNAWTQKADFGGTARTGAVGFSIGSKGYIGTGYDGIYPHFYKNDFWEYDPGANIWTQKANFGGAIRSDPVGFSISNKGYIGTGYGFSGLKKDFWEYDPATDVWTQKANFGGTARWGAVGFSIDSKGYIGTGEDGDSYNSDFWEYDPAANTWSQKADFGGEARIAAIGLSIFGKGYIGTGFFYDFYDGSSHAQNDFWEYDPVTDIWIQISDFGGTARAYAVGFSIGSQGYIGTGWSTDFWEYTPGTSSCTGPSNLSVTNITSTSAKLKWDAIVGAEGYKVRYKVAGTNVWTVKMTTGTSKTINGLSPNTAYKWEVKTFCHIGAPSVSSEWSSKQDFTTAPLRMGDEVAQQVSFQIYPNPAQDHATIQFSVGVLTDTLPPHSGPYGQSSHVYIKVYDVSGKEIATLLDGDMEQGEHSLQLNTSEFSKGVYLVKTISDFGIENKKLIVQ